MKFTLGNSRCAWQRSVIAFFCALAVFASDAAAQSGRKQAPLPSAPSAKPDAEPPLKLSVVTGPPEVTPVTGVILDYPLPPTNLEYHARGGCLQELKNASAAKSAGWKFIEDEDLPRWEARESARTDEQWVIWMELKFELPPSGGSYNFKLRYLLLEPRTGKIVANGFGNAVRPTWNQPAPQQIALPEQVREAGRDVAKQVIAELQKR